MEVTRGGGADALANPEDIDLGEDDAMEEEVLGVQEKAIPVSASPPPSPALPLPAFSCK